MAARKKTDQPTPQPPPYVEELVHLGLLSRSQVRTLTTKKSLASVATAHFFDTTQALVDAGLLDMMGRFREAEGQRWSGPLVKEAVKSVIAEAMQQCPPRDQQRLQLESVSDPALVGMMDGGEVVRVTICEKHLTVLDLTVPRSRDFRLASKDPDHSAAAFQQLVVIAIMRALNYRQSATGEWMDYERRRAFGQGVVPLSEEEEYEQLVRNAVDAIDNANDEEAG